MYRSKMITKIKNITFVKKYYPNSFQTTTFFGRFVSLVLILGKLLLELRYILGYRELRNLKESIKKDVLVIASGPSVHNISYSDYLGWKEKNNGLIFAVNSYFKSELGQKLVADYYVLSDPLHMDWISNTENDFVEYLNSNPKMVLFLPKRFKPYLDSKIKNVVFFNDTSLEGFSRNVNPTYPRGYLSLTAYKALGIAQFISTQKIYIIGIDNSHFRNFQVDKNNQLFQTWNNFHYDSNAYPTSKMDDYYNGVSDYFYDTARAFYQLRFFDKSRIINLDIESLVDIFNKLEEKF
jgi:hypothetical protein